MTMRDLVKPGAAVLGWVVIWILGHRLFMPGYRDPLWWVPAILVAYSLFLVAIGRGVLRFTGQVLLLLTLLPVIMSFWICVPEPADWRHAHQTRSLMESIRMGTELYEEHFGVPAPWDQQTALLALLKGSNAEKIGYIELRERDSGPSGILLDGWGEPVVFSTSATSRTITSAGKDHTLGTRDDLLVTFPQYANKAIEGTAK